MKDCGRISSGLQMQYFGFIETWYVELIVINIKNPSLII